MPSTALAADTGVPASIPILGRETPRRGFLSGLARLPLIGGSVSLLGRPTAVAEPVTFDLMQAYKTWLHYEHRCLSWELADHPDMVSWYGGTRGDRYDKIEPLISFVDVGDADSWHWRDGRDRPSTRAALVLSAVGCDWRERESGQ